MMQTLQIVRGRRARRLALLAGGASLVLGSVSFLRADTARAPDYGLIARFVAEGLPLAHVTHQEFGDKVSERALQNFLDALDFDRSIFLAGDVESFRTNSLRLDDRLRRGHIEFAYEVFNLFKQRAHECLAMVEAQVAEGFDTSNDETYVWKRKDAPWPPTPDERRELWRKKIENEYIGFQVNRLLREEEQAAAPEPDPAATNEPPPAATLDADELLSPENQILKKYRQFVTVLDGHDEEWILQLYLSAFTQAYDAHTTYLSPRATEDFDISMKLSLTGIGAILKFDEGAARIVSLIAGGPAERDGRLVPGDRIVAVAQAGEDPVDILFWPLYKSVRLIRGEPGTKVTLTVIPTSDKVGTTLRTIELTRDVIRLEDRAAKAVVRELPDASGSSTCRVGVITLPDFYADQRGKKRGEAGSKSSAEDIRRLLEDLQFQEVDGILLDLRNNGGGSLPDAVEMTGFFVDHGPIVQVRANRRVQRLQDPEPGALYEGPLVVLVNRLSASASEILAGALQDYGRALVVGDTKTHGKGTVQSVFPLDPRNPAFGSLKVTTAEFYRIDGRSTQFHGVTPDIHLRSAMDVMEIGEEYLPNVLPPGSVEPAPFDADAALRSRVNQLAARSQSRLDANPEYASYAKLVDRLAERMQTSEITLSLPKRLAMAREDKALEEFESRLAQRLEDPSEPSEGTDETAAARRDLILDEALQILRDLIASPSGEPHS